MVKKVQERESFEGWCILEVMGHRRLAGFVQEAVIAGGSFLRIDVPAGDRKAAAVTQYYAASSIYAITPTTEKMAREVAAASQVRPVNEWELRALPVSTVHSPNDLVDPYEE